MPDRISKTQRWLDLIALLLNRRIPLGVEEIMERIPAYARNWEGGDETARASARRMFERDKDELRAMGIPIESTRYEINYGAEVMEGYRIQRRDFYLPYLKVLGADSGEPGPSRGSMGVELDPDEARLALDALRGVAELPAFPFVAEAEAALSKLTFDISLSRYPAPPSIQLEKPGTEDVVDRLRTLSDALLSGKRVRFSYHGINRGETTDREVEPYGLFLQRDWYLVARDPAREAVRLFRVSRMDGLAMNTRAPKERDFETPVDFSLRDFVGRRAWELSAEEPISAEVRFAFPSSLLADRNGDGELVRDEADGSTVRRFEVTDANPFLRWVLGFAGEAAVIAPPELRDDFYRMAAEVAALYGSRDG